MSHKHMVLTAVGPDRPGLVKEISTLIHSSGGNLEDSRMAVLAGEFALIVLLSGPPEALEQIKVKSRELEQQLSFTITLRETSRRPAPGALSRQLLEVTGVDQPGIVRSLSEILATFQVNVASLESRLSNAAFTGTQIFTLRAELEGEGDAPLAQLREKMEQVCSEKNFNMVLTPLEG